MIRLTVVLVALSAGLALADVVSDVESLYNDGEFEQALKKADAAIASSKTTPAQAAKLHLTRGLCLLSIGQQDKAKAAFVAALKKDPSAELDPSRVGSDALDLFEKARAQFPAMLSIAVANDLPAKVKLDGQPMGPAPLTTQVSSGKHVVELVHADGRTARAEVMAKAGTTQTVKLDLGGGPIAKTEPVKTEPIKTEPVKTEPTKTEPKKTEPTKTEPTKTEPVKMAAVDEPPPPMPPVEVRASGPAPNLIGIVPLAAGVVAGVVGGIALGVAQADYDRLTAGTAHVYPSEEAFIVADGNRAQTVGWVLMPVAVAAVATGVTLLVLQPGREKVAVGGFIGPDGTSVVSVRGAFP